jgi:F-type H+-transporting ATPase subunit gamma
MASGSGRRGGLRLARILSGNVNSYLSSGAEKASTAAWRSTSQLSSAEIAPFGARSVSAQIVRNRMRSVKSIQKKTKAMKMVAASKLA